MPKFLKIITCVMLILGMAVPLQAEGDEKLLLSKIVTSPMIGEDFSDHWKEMMQFSKTAGYPYPMYVSISNNPISIINDPEYFVPVILLSSPDMDYTQE